MSLAARVSGALVVALAGWQLAWHLSLSPPQRVAPWALATFFILPLLPSLALLVARHRHAPFWGAVAALFYFSHGVMEAWARPEVRWLALVQATLAAALIVAASWDGVRARFSRPKA